MSTPNHKQILRIPFTTALYIGVLLAVRAAWEALIPPQWCGGTPVDGRAYVFAWTLAMIAVQQIGMPDLKPVLRQTTVMAAGLIAAELAARLIVGCTPLAAWLNDGRFFVDFPVMAAVLMSLAYFHDAVIEPRWARAMGDGRKTDGAGDAK